jgi:hypothetical protein
MSRTDRLRLVLIKPSKYNTDGFVERFRWGSIPNSSLPYMRSLTPDSLAGADVEIHAIDEYVQTDLRYLELLRRSAQRTLLGLVGVQSHQFHRALDLAALAIENGHLAVVGGPHPMTCDTSDAHGRGISFALSEAELVWPRILEDAIVHGELEGVYGGDRRWQTELDPPTLIPPSRADLRRYASRMLGVYPARGCPYRCNFCSIIKIAGHQVRSQPVATTLASLRAARKAGVRAVFFTSDNFNKYAQAEELLEAMIEERIGLPFFVQCDVQVVRQPELIRLLGWAGCFQIFLGVESFDRETLKAAHKHQNHPRHYREIVGLCREAGIATTFANILGFPQDTEESILEHLAALREVGPEMASFYILTPIPGTEQYDDFRRQGLITERNLDRFDAYALTWAHPSLSNETLQELVFHCYREFFSTIDSFRKGLAAFQRAHRVARSTMIVNVLAHSLVSRYAARKGLRVFRALGESSLELSAGVRRRTLDRVEDYLPLRRRTFGFELAPLPDSLELSAHDQEINRDAKLTPLSSRGGVAASA